MEPFAHHVFVCTQEKAEGVPCCSAKGSGRVLEALHRELARQGLDRDVQVTSCGCLGICDEGPAMIVYPEAHLVCRDDARRCPAVGDLASSAGDDP